MDRGDAGRLPTVVCNSNMGANYHFDVDRGGRGAVLVSRVRLEHDRELPLLDRVKKKHPTYDC
jgi:hypothetical protein